MLVVLLKCCHERHSYSLRFWIVRCISATVFLRHGIIINHLGIQLYSWFFEKITCCGSFSFRNHIITPAHLHLHLHGLNIVIASHGWPLAPMCTMDLSHFVFIQLMLLQQCWFKCDVCYVCMLFLRCQQTTNRITLFVGQNYVTNTYKIHRRNDCCTNRSCLKYERMAHDDCHRRKMCIGQSCLLSFYESCMVRKWLFETNNLCRVFGLISGKSIAGWWEYDHISNA